MTSDVEELERRTATAAELVKEYKILLRQSEISASVDSKLKRSVERLRKKYCQDLRSHLNWQGILAKIVGGLD